MNLAGEKPDVLLSEKELPKVVKQLDYENVVGQDSLTRFDSDKRKKKKKKKPGMRAEEGVQANGNANRIEGGNPEYAQHPKPNQNRPPQQAGGQNQRPNNNSNKRPNNGPRPPRPQQPPQS